MNTRESETAGRLATSNPEQWTFRDLVAYESDIASTWPEIDHIETCLRETGGKHFLLSSAGNDPTNQDRDWGRTEADVSFRVRCAYGDMGTSNVIPGRL